MFEFKKVIGFIENTVKEVGHIVEEGVKQAGNGIKKVGEEAQKIVDPIVNQIKEQGNNTIHWLNGAEHDVGDWIKNRANDIKNYSEIAAKSVLNTSGDIAKIASGMQNGLQNFTQDALSRAYFLVKGDLDYSIIQAGVQINGLPELKAGDILLKQGGVETRKLLSKEFLNESKEVVSLLIDGVQIVTNRSGHKYVGAGLLGHAAIYIGNGQIAEAVGDGCAIYSMTDEHHQNYNYYAIRALDNNYAEKISSLARYFAQTGKISYSKAGLPSAVIGGTMASQLNEKLNDTSKYKRICVETGGSTSMFCSEFVTFILNCAADDCNKPRTIEVAQDRITPEEIYVKLREDKTAYQYIGELHKGVR